MRISRRLCLSSRLLQKMIFVFLVRRWRRGRGGGEQQQSVKKEEIWFLFPSSDQIYHQLGFQRRVYSVTKLRAESKRAVGLGILCLSVIQGEN